MQASLQGQPYGGSPGHAGHLSMQSASAYSASGPALSPYNSLPSGAASQGSAAPRYNSFSSSAPDGNSPHLTASTFVNTAVQHRTRGQRGPRPTRGVDTLGATLPVATQRHLQNRTMASSSVGSWCDGIDDALDEMREANIAFLGKYAVLGALDRRAGACILE